MTRGKHTCKILKEIRRQIAAANDIEFITSECQYKGDCRGTCPKCEAEVRYLEQQLQARTLAGKKLALAGISAGMFLLSGCNVKTSTEAKDIEQSEPVESADHTSDTIRVLEDDARAEAPADTIDESIKFVTELAVVGDPEINPGEIDEEGEIIISEGEVCDDTDIIKSPKIQEAENEIFDAIVDSLPEFPGGTKELLRIITESINYPKEEKAAGTQGRVIVRALIKEDGSIGKVVLMKSVSEALDDEAIRIVKSLPKFKPAMYAGDPVEYWFIIPVNFKLQN